MRLTMLCAAAVLLSLPALARAERPSDTKTYSDTDALNIGWPQLTGPLGNFSALRTQTPLIDDLSQAKLLWTSETKDLGRAKGSSQAYRRSEQFTDANFAKMGSHPGSWGGVIVAGSYVFAHSWRPTRTEAEHDQNKIRLDADDFVIAIDALTGKTKWQTTIPGGILKGGGKRQGWHMAPVFVDGKVIAFTTTGLLVALSGNEGAIVWQSEEHPARASLVKAREEALKNLETGKFTYALTPNWTASLSVIGDTVLVPDGATGYVAFDAATGKKKWAAPNVGTRWAQPTAWYHDGKPYIVTANEKGELRLLNPADGKALWTLTGLGPNWPTLTVGGDHVLVNIVPNSGKAKGQDRMHGRWGAVKLSLEKGEKTWELPKTHVIPVWMDTGARMRVAYQNGVFLIPHLSQESGVTEDGDSKGAQVASNAARATAPALLVDAASGKILSELPASGDRDKDLCGLFYWAGDKVISRGDSYHGPTHGGRHPWSLWSTADNKLSQLPGNMDLGEFTNGYEVCLEVPLVAGLMFERNEKGQLLCYDLRKK